MRKNCTICRLEKVVKVENSVTRFHGNHSAKKKKDQEAIMAEPDTPESTGSVLESALIDQRMRADRHRANFESLKAEHLTLQEVQ